MCGAGSNINTIYSNARALLVSIINKVIADLEERQILGSNNAGKVFSGLNATENRPRRYSSSIARLFIVLLFFVASVSATYALMGGRESAIIAKEDIAQVSNKSLQLISERVLNKHDKDKTSLSPNSLKLDFSLPVIDSDLAEQLEVYSAEITQTSNRINVSDVQVIQTNSTMQFRLALSAEANYRAYSLTSPNRVVVHVDKADLSGSLPDLATVPGLSNIRLVDRDRDEVMLVIDTRTFQQVDEIELLPNGDSYQLAFSLKSTEPAGELKVAEQDGFESVVHDISEYESAQFGEMTKQHSHLQVLQSIERRYKKAQVLYRQQKELNANGILSSLLKENPDYVPARSLLSRKLIEQGQLQKAESLLEQGLNLNKTQADWANLYARLQINRGETELAIDVLETAAPEIKTDPGYYAFLAALYQKTDNHRQAVVTYRQVVEQESTNSVWWMGLAISLESLAEDAEALFAYRRAMQGKSMSPDLQQYVLGKISYLSKQG